MSENWYALCISILEDFTPERALAVMGLRPAKISKKNLQLTIGQALNLKYLLKNMTWAEMAEEFGMNAEALRNQVNKVLKKLPRKPTKVFQDSQCKYSSRL